MAGPPRSLACTLTVCLEFQCCGRLDQSDFIFNLGMGFSFSVYGRDPVVRWETVQWLNHHGVDLKLQLMNDSLSSVKVG